MLIVPQLMPSAEKALEISLLSVGMLTKIPFGIEVCFFGVSKSPEVPKQSLCSGHRFQGRAGNTSRNQLPAQRTPKYSNHRHKSFPIKTFPPARVPLPGGGVIQVINTLASLGWTFPGAGSGGDPQLLTFNISIFLQGICSCFLSSPGPCTSTGTPWMCSCTTRPHHGRGEPGCRLRH